MTTRSPQDPNQPANSRTTPAQSLFEKALALHQQGAILEARTAYLEILKTQNQHFDSKHLLGVTYIQTGEFDTARQVIVDAIKINPNVALAYNNLGKALKDLNRLDEALIHYEKALSLNPQYAEAHNNRGNVLQMLKRYEDALASFEQALALKPDYVEALHNRGKALKELHRPEEALDSYNRALAIRPRYSVALCSQADVLVELGRAEDALTSYEQALMVSPNDPEIYNNLGVALQKLERLDQALVQYDKALLIKPNFEKAHFNRGNTLLALKRFGEAVISYDNALMVHSPTNPANTELADVYLNRGNTLFEMKRLDDATHSYEQALRIRSGYAEAVLAKSFVLLLQGKFKEAWPLYESRWDCEKPSSPKRSFDQPGWLGKESLLGKTILLHTEQGLGDNIHFCRYVKLVSELGATVILQAPQILCALFSGLKGLGRVVSIEDPLPDFDYHSPLLSLPYAFNTTIETIPAQVPYLSACPERVKRWGAHLGDHGFKIGICWQGTNAERAFPLSSYYGLSKIDGVRLISLHRGLGENQLTDIPCDMHVENLGPTFDGDGNAFMDTAAVMKHCDVIISNDTAVAHMAGALGMPVWVALRHVPDWRWLIDRSDTPWYPTMRLFRQKQPGDWASTFDDIELSLKKIL